jgi:hypothetical protein
MQVQQCELCALSGLRYLIWFQLLAFVVCLQLARAGLRVGFVQSEVGFQCGWLLQWVQ